MANPQTINGPQFMCKGGKFMAENRPNNETPDFSEGINEGNEQPTDPTNNDPTLNHPNNDPNLDDPITMDVPPNTDNPLQAPPDSTREEELATEITADDNQDTDQRSVDEETFQANSVMGWIALILSIASYFMMPVILGSAGIIVGFIARNRGAQTLGNTAIIAGIVSILITLFILPFV